MGLSLQVCWQTSLAGTTPCGTDQAALATLRIIPQLQASGLIPDTDAALRSSSEARAGNSAFTSDASGPRGVLGGEISVSPSPSLHRSPFGAPTGVS